MPITSTPYTAVYGPLSVAGATCQLWLDGVDPLGNGSVPANGSTVSTWMDKSGNGRNASANTIGGTFNRNALNGNGGINFDTLNTKYYRTPSFVASSTNTPTIFFVCQQTVYNFSQNTVLLLAEINYLQFILYTRTANNININLNLDIYNTDPSTGLTGIPISSPAIVSVVGTGAPSYNATMYGNGTFNLSFTGTATNPMSTSSPYIIGQFIGNAYEVIFYNTALADTQRQQVEGYLAQKWGLTSQLPPGHPGLTQTLYNSKVYQSRVPLSPQPIYQNFNPKQLTGCQLWLDGADPAGTGTPPANGSTVSTWIDKSGFGNHFGGSAPYSLDTTYNKKGLAFNGNSFSQNNGSLYSISTAAYTIFTVHRFSGITGMGNIYRSAPSSTQLFFRNSGNTLQIMNANQNYVFYNGTGTDSSSISGVGCMNVGNTSSAAYLNGTSLGTAVSGTSANIALFIGSYAGLGEFFIGTIFEIIIYNTSLTTYQQQQVEGYLAWKWGLQSSLDASNLYKNVPPGLPWQASLTSGLTRLPPIDATGGTITFSGAFKIHTFTTVGTTNFVVRAINDGVSVQVLVVGGGGGGGNNCGGGGGAGGAIFVNSQTVTSGSYSIIVGAGGAGGVTNTVGSNGGNSSAFGSTGIGGGGGGGSVGQTGTLGVAGGCGGGSPGGDTNVSSGGGAAQQAGGFAGGYNPSNTPGINYGAGGGGGMGSVGSNGSGNNSGNGGSGATYTIGGTAYTVCGGGGGGGYSGTAGTGGSGIGGNGNTSPNASGFDATYYGSGGGGSAGGGSAPLGGNAYQGIVIIAYNYL